jgi:hypothetical protein
MKRIFIATGLAVLLTPSLALAELDYNIVDVGFASKLNRGTAGIFTEFGLGASRSISDNLYLGASYQTGIQPMSPANGGNQRVNSINLSAGFHTPLNQDVDMVAAGRIYKGTDGIAGSNSSANGYNAGAGVRAQFPHDLEGSVMAVYSSISNSAYSDKDTYVNAQFGFGFTPEIQLYGGIDLFRNDQTMIFGIRVFY